MSSADPSGEPLRLRCPECGELIMAKGLSPAGVVVCTDCGHQFLAAEPGATSRAKHFPGERKDPFLERIKRVDTPLPHVGDDDVPRDFASHSNPVYVDPMTPQRILMGTLAAFAMVVTAMFLVLGAKRGAALDGVSIENRMLMAGFVSLVATALLVYSNTRVWLLMLTIGLVAGAGLVFMPLHFSGGSAELSKDVRRVAEITAADLGIDSKTYTEKELIELIGTKPLREERNKLMEEGKVETALGLWLRNLEVRNCLLIRDHIIREMDASPETHFYPRGMGDYLMVVTGIEGDLQALADVSESLGEVAAIHDVVHAVEVRVDNERFKTAPMDKLTNPDDSEFYLLNSKELNSIDLIRVSAAVRRLSEVEATLYRTDISNRLVELLGADWYENKGELCRALMVWSSGDGKAGDLALEQALKMHEQSREIPSEMIALSIKEGAKGVQSLLRELWAINPSRWEPWFREVGPEGEKVLLLHYDQTSGMLRQSACRLLGHIGSKDSLAVLKVTAASAPDAETRIIATNSIQMIEKRMSPEN